MKKLLFTLIALLLFGYTYAAHEVYSDAIRQKAESGDADAQCDLGNCYFEGNGITQDYAKAVEWYTKSAQQGNPRGQNNLGNCYEGGNGVTKDYAQALYWFNKAAQQNFSYSQCSLGICYASGYGVEKDYTKAFDWFTKAAKQGHAMAQCNLGYCYMQGYGVDKDYAKALNWFNKAAQQGNTTGQYYMGVCYAKGRGVAQDYAQAVEWYTKAAQQGDDDAQLLLGYSYEKGQGVAQDYSNAIYWYAKSAQQGNATAQFNLGVFCETGRGMTKDLAKAVEWYTESARQGYASAQFNLGNCYYNGQGIAKDNGKAFYWFNQAAQQGLSLGQYYLGICYEKGKGVAQDCLTAYEWYKKAADAGNENAKAKCNNADFLKLVADVRQNNKQNNNQSPVAENKQNNDAVKAEPVPTTSAVDINIPVSKTVNSNTFAVIVANEKYRQEAKVPFAINDGNTFAKYCKETLGMPTKNVHCINDASLNDIRHEVGWLKDVMAAYNGEAKVIFYYAGHGIPDEKHQTAYLLPVDGYGNDATTGYSLDDLYSALGAAPAKDVVVLLDACFSGAKRDGGMLASARGVAIKVKDAAPQGNMLVFTAAQGDETAFPYKEQGHGLFTYYLLKDLQDTKGDASLKQLVDYVTTNVRQQSIVINGKSQTPTANVSPTIANSWQKLTLK
jgi:TPR repeat protein